MNINELEKRTSITKQNIRFYEKRGLLNPSRNTVNNYREYTEADVEILQISGSVSLGILMGICMIPILIWTFQMK